MKACYVFHIKWAYKNWKQYLSKKNNNNFWKSGDSDHGSALHNYKLWCSMSVHIWAMSV